ncbi:hypothetical protein P171DRAFT_519334 [Karstenula rhodostoma CBS 690.94]|uniref:Uncharacterized protein n=1 Tax=Karstenula rhodostoma CBS 690.94 TaxID=1392251 RepID=A0A9P4UE39_9PLEO|nr:hypothetical protein P171DRAFT_519334 [Karstenula rhodostoma CBS 690.94]
MTPIRRRRSSHENMAVPNSSLRNLECPANVLSLAGVLDDSITQSTLGEWLQSSDEDIHARLARLSSFSDGLGPSSASNPPCPLSCSVRSTGSSMAPACVHQSNASTQAPSLSNFSEATPTETSISTGQASFFTGGVPLLEDDNGVLVRPQHTCRTPVYECAFWFLRCSYISNSMEEWHTHCLSHFRGEEPPRSVGCPLCDWEHLSDDGKIAWDRRMDHIAYEHFQRGQTLKTSRPDFGLFHHLWNKRLIDDQDLKELKGGNHNLTRVPLNFTVTGTGRRDRDGRRQPQRTQHIGGMRRQVAPVRT